MRRSGFGWWRLAKQVVLGTAAQVVSTVQSTFSAASFAPTADGVTTDVATLTLKDNADAAIPGRGVVFSVHRTLIDVAACTVAVDDAEIAETTGVANVTAYIYEQTPEGHALPGIPAASLVLASTGTGNTITAVDTHTDQNGRFRWTFSSTVAEAKTLSLTACGLAITDTAAVTVTGTPSAPTLVFASQWATATGTSASALTDGGAWDGPGSGSGNGAEIDTLTDLDTALTLDIPAELSTVANAQYVRNAANGVWALGLAELDAGTPGDGDEWYYRCYRAMVVPDSVTYNGGTSIITNLEHGSESAETSGGDGWSFPEIVPYQDGTCRVYFRDHNSGGRFYCDTFLDKNALYRYEWHISYGATDCTYEVRIYNTAGTLVLDESDFYLGNGSVLGYPLGTLLSACTFPYTPIEHRYVRIGSNGPSTNYPGYPTAGDNATIPAGTPMFVTTAYAKSHTAWCAAYVNGNG